jgi:uncharacterized protein
MSPHHLLLAAALLLPSAALAQAQVEPSAREIVVSGTGEASAAPDIATANFAVERNAKTAREALDQANAGMRAVIDGMKALGVEDRDLQTSGFGISPQYRYDDNSGGRREPPELVGYEVRNSLAVRVRDVTRVGEVLDRAVSLGVNSGGSVAFDFADAANLRAEARRKAVADATATARTLTEAAGVPLGPVVRIAMDDAASPPPTPMYRMAADAAAPAVPVQAGVSTIGASVTVTFALGSAN